MAPNVFRGIATAILRLVFDPKSLHHVSQVEVVDRFLRFPAPRAGVRATETEVLPCRARMPRQLDLERPGNGHTTVTVIGERRHTHQPCTSHANDVTQRDGHHTEDTHTKDAPHTQTMSSSGTDHTHLNGYVTRSRKDTLTKEAPHILTVSPNGTDDTHLNGYVTPSHEDTPQRRTSHANDVI